VPCVLSTHRRDGHGSADVLGEPTFFRLALLGSLAFGLDARQQRTDPELENVVPAKGIRTDTEVPINAAIDYLLSRDDVDTSRIVIYGGGENGATS
jgi:hypothetical protein